MTRIAIAGAPVSFGVFELTPEGAETLTPDQIVDALADAGFDGIDLGPLGFLGRGSALRRRLDRRGLALAGGWVQLPFTDDDAFAAAVPELREALRVFGEATEIQADADAGEPAASAPPSPPRTRRMPLPTLADAGSPARAAAPGRGAEVDPLTPADWNRLTRNLQAATAMVRDAGLEPTFHHHAGTSVESVAEIDRLLDASDIGLTLDTGHLALAGGDPVEAVERWGDRIDHLHLKDVDRAVLARTVEAGGGMREVWASGAFVRFGAGDLDLESVVRGALARGFAGWIVIEQDVLVSPGADLAAFLRERADDQRASLGTLAGWL